MCSFARWTFFFKVVLGYSSGSHHCLFPVLQATTPLITYILCQLAPKPRELQRYQYQSFRVISPAILSFIIYSIPN